MRLQSSPSPLLKPTSHSPASTSVHRVVITSSVAAVANPPITERTIADETSWNINSPKEVEEKGDNATPLGIYRASKTLAERAAWKFVDVNKPEWDLVTINPPLVFGVRLIIFSIGLFSA